MNKLYIVAGIFVIAVAGYWIFFMQSTSFDDGLNQINSFWEKQDLKPSYLTSAVKVFAIEESKLIALKSDLDNFRASTETQSDSKDKEKLLLLTEIQLDLVSNAIMQKKIFESIDVFETNDFDADFLCASMDEAKELNNRLVLQKGLAESFNEKAAEFSGTYPEEAEKAGLSSLELEITSEEKLLELEETLEGLEAVC